MTARWWILTTSAGSFAFHGTADAAAVRLASFHAHAPLAKRHADLRDAYDGQLVAGAKAWAAREVLAGEPT